MKNISKNINKYANISYGAFNKKAKGEGLKYISSEFGNIGNEVNDIVAFYRKDLNGAKSLNPQSLSIGTKIIQRNQKLLYEFSNVYHKMFANFTKSIERNHKKELIAQAGKDYGENLKYFIENPEIALSSNGLFAKYKMILQLFAPEDASLLNKVLKFIDYELDIYDSLFYKANVNLQTMPTIANMNGTFSWLDKYEDLFKFAAKNDPIEIPIDEDVIELTEDDFMEPIQLHLTKNEISTLKGVYDAWKQCKLEIEKYKPTLDQIVSNAIVLQEKNLNQMIKQNDMFEGAFESLRALKRMIKMYIDEGNSEQTFYQAVGFDYKNAIIKIDNWVYLLSTIMPAVIEAYKHIQKLPKPVSNHPPYPEKVILNTEWDDLPDENDWFSAGEDYETGNRSGIDNEDGEEVIFKDKSLKPEKPMGEGIISYPARKASDLLNSKKISK